MATTDSSGGGLGLGPTSSESDQNNNDGGRGGDEKARGRLPPKAATYASGRLMSNLPYMGELTFDSRPRRGRKPKKADICHLISKNYGITFPLAYVNQPNSSLETHGTSPAVPLAAKGSFTPISDLESSHFAPFTMISNKTPAEEDMGTEEPLNLCLRDRTLQSSDSNLVKPAPAKWLLQQTESKAGRGRKRSKKVSKKVQIQQPTLPPPPSEVSICKFKFTGGPKPSLQEKKMLSVDSGGNFRFYSDKQPSGSKGQSQMLSRSPAMPLLPPVLPPFQHEFTPPADQPLSPGNSSSSEDSSSSPNSEFGSKRKRRTRKSLMREKLERTFKEKGFLIQTQQLESAEGATYCKFRQLRKFTRYLFRSWKDYLPENVQGISGSGNSFSEIPTPAQPAGEEESAGMEEIGP